MSCASGMRITRHRWRCENLPAVPDKRPLPATLCASLTIGRRLPVPEKYFVHRTPHAAAGLSDTSSSVGWTRHLLPIAGLLGKSNCIRGSRPIVNGLISSTSAMKPPTCARNDGRRAGGAASVPRLLMILKQNHIRWPHRPDFSKIETKATSRAERVRIM